MRMLFGRPAVLRTDRCVGPWLPVHSGTALFGAGPYTLFMQLQSIKVIGAALWVLAVCIASVFGNVNSLSGWTVVAGLAILPLVTMWRWNNPDQSMSESIQEARR